MELIFCTMDQFRDSFVQFLTDLRSKASDLNELNQGGAILTALQAIKPTSKVSITSRSLAPRYLLTAHFSQTFAAFLASLVKDSDDKDTINEAAEDGISQIAETENEFQPN